MARKGARLFKALQPIFRMDFALACQSQGSREAGTPDLGQDPPTGTLSACARLEDSPSFMEQKVTAVTLPNTHVSSSRDIGALLPKSRGMRLIPGLSLQPQWMNEFLVKSRELGLLYV